MPGFDTTGPQGSNFRPGRGLGPCGTDGATDVSQQNGRMRGAGRGNAFRGEGRGRCRGTRCFPQQVSELAEIKALLETLIAKTHAE
jgi:hypothetical protein